MTAIRHICTQRYYSAGMQQGNTRELHFNMRNNDCKVARKNITMIYNSLRIPVMTDKG